jgi:hypothetical protein
MRRAYVLFIATALVCGLASPAAAQKRAARSAQKKAPPAAEVPLETFTFSTIHESWRLGDPEPTHSVVFDGQPLPIGSRRITRSATTTGATDLTFPISDFVFYEQDPEKPKVNSVIARYEDGKLTAIYVFYKPQSYALARDGFAPMANGKSFYKTLASRKGDDTTYLKQAVSNGLDDPSGGLWVETIAISAVRQGAPATRVADTRNGKRALAQVRAE